MIFQRRRHPSPEHGRFVAEQMPPPAKVPRASTSAKPHFGDSHTSPTLSSASGRTDLDSPRVQKTPKTGFKPIGEPSSTVKLFFPRDEEADNSRHKPTASHRTESEVPAKRAHDEVVTDRDEDSKGSVTSRLLSQQVSGLREPLPKTKSLAPQQVPVRAIRDSLKASLLPKLDNGDVSMSPIQQPHTAEPEVEGTPRPSSPSTTSCKDLYAIVSQVGEGTFGKVYKARNVITNVHVALKRIRMEAEKDGFPVTAMREIKLLQSLRHKNVVRLYEMMVSNGN
jgi:hypothetical protein